MAPQKETIMLLKVDLDCPRCYKKVKKVLCQCYQIHDQVFNEKQNTVMIKVLCCSPEKIRDKLCYKGGKSIKSIEILEPKKPPPPPPPEKPADKPPPEPAPAPPPPAEKPKEEAPPPPEPAPDPPKITKNGSKNGSPKPEKPPEEAPPEKPKDPEPPKQVPEPASEPPKPAAEPKPEPPPPKPAPGPVPVPQLDPAQYYPVYPVNVCCSECYESGITGPCHHGYGYGYGFPPPPPPAPVASWGYYNGYPAPPPPSGGYGGGSAYNYKPGYCVTQCGDYISDENPTACVIM